MGIKALANKLELSISTVSRALNSSGPVSAETRQRVMDAAAELGYSPNISAGNLRKGRVDTIGLMLPVYSQAESHTLALFMGLADGIRSVLSRHQLDLAIFQSDSGSNELTQLKRIVGRRQVDGLIVSNTRRHDQRLDFLAKQKFPFVAFGRSDSGGEHAWIDLDFESAVVVAVERLVGFNHRRIGIVMPGHDAMQAHIYLKSYKQILKRLNIGFDNNLVRYSEFSERGGYGAAESLLALETPPTAILFQCDSMAIGAYRKLSEIGLKPGRDIAISTGVLTSQVPDYLSPRLTGFTLTVREVGIRMGEAILARVPSVAAYFNSALIQEVWPLQLKAQSSDAMVIDTRQDQTAPLTETVS